METSKFDLDRKAIDRLKRKIVIAENTNLRTKNKTDAQMIRDIKKWIEEDFPVSSRRFAEIALTLTIKTTRFEDGEL